MLNDFKKVHFIGVGGIGMSGLARLFLHEGKKVSGSDRASSEITKSLEQEGVRFFPEQVAENISSSSGLELVVYTEAMSQDNSEMATARELGVPMMSYFEALALVANQYYLIAVAGTHGKTTTTAMLIDILEAAGYDPTAIVGSLRTKTHSNYRAGKSKYFIVEADEYKENFRFFQPDVLVINNLDHDHVDYYPTLKEVQQAFNKLAKKVPVEGAVITETASKNIAPALENLQARIIDYKKNIDLTLPMKQPGLHNRLNAAAAKTVAEFLGIEKEVVDKSLSNFAGTWRRFELKGEVQGAPVYDDYAHNPQKVAAVIAGAREMYPDKNIKIIFQPHTYTRTKELFTEFVSSLGQADSVYLLPIYAAREQDDGSIRSEMIADQLKANGWDALYFADFSAVEKYIRDTASNQDVILVVGAGDVTEVAKRLTE